MSRRGGRTATRLIAMVVAFQVLAAAAAPTATAALSSRADAAAGVQRTSEHPAAGLAGTDRPDKPKPSPTAKGKSDDAPQSAAASTHGRGWWKRAYSEHGAKPIDADTAQAYLDEVAALSAVFPEQTAAGDAEAAHDALSPTGPDRRDRATAALLVAWLEFASGDVADDAVVPLKSGDVTFSVLMSAAEEVILDPTATRAELTAVERDLARIRHAR